MKRLLQTLFIAMLTLAPSAFGETRVSVRFTRLLSASARLINGNYRLFIAGDGVVSNTGTSLDGKMWRVEATIPASPSDSAGINVMNHCSQVALSYQSASELANAMGRYFAKNYYLDGVVQTPPAAVITDPSGIQRVILNLSLSPPPMPISYPTLDCRLQ